jgi:predicted hydrocarbon binding protein/KaiC/GvpD/RAD55 family RecA-like ATPase
MSLRFHSGQALAQIKEAPDRGLILLVGPPGAGKSAFCHQVVLNSVATARPVIFVTTEQSGSDVMSVLRESGLGEPIAGAVSLVDAFSETVGVDAPDRPDTLCANCMDLNSISIAATRLHRKLAQKGVLLVFDSLTSPYLLSGAEVTRFMRLFLSRFAAEGNSVLALIDEGCGKEEDLIAMMSVANGIIKIAVENGSRVLNVVKHPVVEPTRIELPASGGTSIPLQAMDDFVTKHYEAVRSGFQTRFRSKVGDFVHVLWGSFTLWSGMLWDPRRFPPMLYDLNKEITYQGATLYLTKLGWHMRLLWRFMPNLAHQRPRYFGKRILPIIAQPFKGAGGGIIEYLPGASKPDEHYVRIHESAGCCALEDVGASLCYDDASYLAGMMKYFDKEGRDWNAVETTCVGEGSPYCEFKLAPGELDELDGYLTAVDGVQIERITRRLLERVADFILHGKLPCDRPTLGDRVQVLPFTGIPALASGRYRMALRMGGAMTGKRLGEYLVSAGMGDDEVIRRVIDLMEYCKVGKVALGDTIRIEENCETFGLETGEPSCFFTTGFFNGLFSAVKDQRVREVKCIAAGDPYCEWEIG